MRHFITFALGALMASSAVTVHGLPILKNNSLSARPLDLNLHQLTQCVTQILDGAEICNLSLLEGLVPSLLKTVGDLLSLDGHILDLSTLTDLVNQAVASLIKDGKAKQDGSDIQVTEVVVIVRGLLVDLPATDVVSGVAKRDFRSDVTIVLAHENITMAELKHQLQELLGTLNVSDDDLTNLPVNAQDAVCPLLERFHFDCKDALALLNKQE